MKPNNSAATMHRGSHFFFGDTTALKFRLFEQALALATLLRLAVPFFHSSEWLTASGFHLNQSERGALMPHAVPVVPPMLVPMVGFAILAATLSVLTKEGARWAHAVLAILCIYFFHLDPVSAGAGDVLCIVGWLVLVSAPPRSFGLDGQSRISIVSIRILQITLTLFFIRRAVDLSLFGGWLTNWQTLWSLAQGPERTGVTAWMLRNLPQGLWSGIQGLWLAAQIALPICIWIKPVRQKALVMAGFSGLLMLAFFPGHWQEVIFIAAYLILFADSAGLKRALDPIFSRR